MENKLIKALSGICLSSSRAINTKIAYEKQMFNLTAILGVDQKDSKEIKDLVEWFRNEYKRRPEQYIGDSIVMKEIRYAAAKGYPLIISICEAYMKLKRNLYIIDRIRITGK